MLRGILHTLPPELSKMLCEMGHSDRIVIVGGNFPVEPMGRDTHIIHMEGHGVSEILEAILSFFPLDTYAEYPVCLMPVADGGTVETPIWDQYVTLVEACDSRGRSAVGYIKWFAFYKEVKKAHAIIATSKKALYASIMLREGVVIDQGLQTGFAKTVQLAKEQKVMMWEK